MSKSIGRILAPLLVLSLHGIAAIVRAVTWLLNRWTRRQVMKRAALRRERARELRPYEPSATGTMEIKGASADALHAAIFGTIAADDWPDIIEEKEQN
jgi:hypothetical protein